MCVCVETLLYVMPDGAATHQHIQHRPHSFVFPLEKLFVLDHKDSHTSTLTALITWRGGK